MIPSLCHPSHHKNCLKTNVSAYGSLKRFSRYWFEIVVYVTSVISPMAFIELNNRT